MSEFPYFKFEVLSSHLNMH